MKTPPYTTAQHPCRSLLTLLCLLLLTSGGSALHAQLATWDFEGEISSPTTTAANVTASAALFGPSVGSVSFPAGNGSTDAYSGNNWPTAGLAADRYLEISVEADECYTLEVTGISFDERRSGTGPTTLGVIRSFVDGFVPNAFYAGSNNTPIPDNTSWRTQTFTETIMDETKVIFRIYGYNAESTSGTWRFDNISIEGTVIANEPPVVDCSTFTETYNQEAPPPNTPSGGVGPIPADGQLDVTIGFPGGVPITLDLSCIEDDDNDYSEYGISLLSSIAEEVDDCTTTITNTYAISDECGDVADNNVVVVATFTDTEPPTVTCAEFSTDFTDICPAFVGPNTISTTNWRLIGADGSFSSSAAGLYSQTVDVSACVSDNVTDLAGIEYTAIDSYEENSSACSRTIVNEYAFRDECGNVADETVLVKFVFNDPGIAPTITCPPDVVIECGDSTDPANTGMATADDDCPAPPSITFSDLFLPDCGGGAGTLSRTWIVTDECGKTSACVQTILIEDTTPPQVTCAEFTTDIDGGCDGTLTPNVPSGNFATIPNDGVITIGLGIGTGASYNLDLNGCVSDDCTDGFAGMGISLVSSTAGDAACGQTLTNTYSIRDACGNVSNDLVTVVATFGDTEAPTVNCADFTATYNECPDGFGPNTPTGEWQDVPDSGTFLAASGGIFSVLVDLNGCVTDNCADLTDLEYTLVDSYSEDFVPGCSITLVNEIAIRDACGNLADDVITTKITITNEESSTAPVITCPADVTVECGASTDPADTGMATATTDCGDAAITFSDNFAPSGCSSGTGVITRTWRATSACGTATSSCTQLITLADNTAPVVTCADFTMTFEGCPRPLGPNTPDGNFFAIGADGGFTAASGGSFTMFLDLSECITDGCSELAELEVSLADSYEEDRTDCSVTLVNEFFVRDPCGNVADDRIITRFTIENTSDAVIVCPADADLTCGDSTDPANTGMATASDACGDVDVTFSDEITMRCNDGAYVILRTWTAEGCGTPATCVQTIFLRDEEAPVFDDTCPTEFTFTTEEGSDCVLDATISLNVDDEIGLDDTFTVGGLTAPTLAGCVSDNCALDEEISVTVTDITVSHAGFCSRIFAVTFVADDGCFNESEPFTLTYTVEDDTAPEFDAACQIEQFFTTEGGSVCPADATFSLNVGDEIGVNDVFSVGNNELPTLAGCITDNCGEEEDFIITIDAVDVTDQGTCVRTFDVTFIADDGCGNDSEPFTLTYTITDDTAPEFDLACQIDATFFTEDGNVCPADAEISLSEGDVIDVFTGWTVGGIAVPPLQGCVDDNCTAEADLNITVDDITVTDDGTCSRTITVTFIADDGCGNDSEPFVCNYTFVDNTGPEMSFNGIPDGGTYTVECDLPSDTWDPLIDFADLDISDVCSDVDLSTLTEELTQLYGGPCTGNLLTRWQQVFTVEDVCGNETVYTLFTEIIDTTPPVFLDSPEDVTIECDETAETPELEAFDACSEVVYNFTEVRTDGSCPNNYTLTRTWTATDGCGNSSEEVQIVTVEDTTPPEFEFIDEYIAEYEPEQEVFVECSELSNIYAIIANNAVANDNCSGGTPVSYQLIDLGNFDCAEFGYSGAFISRWFTVDECGNAATASIYWFLVDETAPTFQNLPEDTCADAGNLPPVADVQAVDQCEGAALTFSQSEPLDCDGGGQYIERTWTAEDACGNVAIHTQRITLGGANGLAITIDYPEIGDVQDGDIIQLPVDCETGIDFSAADLEAAISVSDGCGGNSGVPTVEISLMDEGSCADNGYLARYRVNISAMDACGNMAELGIMVDLVDQTAPVVTGAAEITLNCGDEVPMPTAVDACGEIASMTFTDSAPLEVSCASNPTSVERTWTVTDDCGNTATFVQTVSLIDSEGPVFSGVPADACNDETIESIITATDACTGETAEVSFSEEMSNVSGCGQVLTRTWTATDACGNVSTATQQVFFDDATAPEIAFTNDLLFGLESGDELFLNVGDGFGDPSDPLLFTAEDVLVTDNCAALTAEVVVEATLSDDCAADGYLARYDYKFIATDPCGNEAVANLTVFYEDNNAPDFFNTPADVTVICAAIPEVADITVSDDYDEDVDVFFNETQEATDDGLLITRTWTAIDDCGNTSIFSQEILVEDNDLDATFSFGSEVIECNSDNNRLGVTASGGTGPYTYEWQLTFPLEDGYITSDPTNRAILFTMGYITQTFSVLITDANGCELLASVTVVCDFEDDEGDFSGNTNDAFSMNAYPNPANEQLIVKAGGLDDAPVTVALYNLFGQEMTRTEVDQWTTQGVTIDTQRFPNGTYLLRLSTANGEVRTREIVILH